MVYGRIFRTKHTIEKESNSHTEGLNKAEMTHRLIETRISSTWCWPFNTWILYTDSRTHLFRTVGDWVYT